MSGTSVDGIDAALVTITGAGAGAAVELQHFLDFPYPRGLGQEIIALSRPGAGSVDTICRMNVLLGELFAEAALALLQEASVLPERVDFIGSHGQTVQHLPEKEPFFGHEIHGTLQIGEPAVIARRTGIVTVADFRPADMAAGGQGAPLVPYFDYVRFRSSEETRLLINIGGIGNVTRLRKGCGLDEVIACDSGPGNMVIDCLVRNLFDRDFDRGGEIALSGSVSAELLDIALQHPYLQLKPPKSTGRELFGADFSQKLLAAARKLGLAKADIVATAAELTVRTLVAMCRELLGAESPGVVIVSGGGSSNRYLMSRLGEELAPAPVQTSDARGVPSGAKEAICFALLANETLCGNPCNVPSATGAQGPAILGKICLP